MWHLNYILCNLQILESVSDHTWHHLRGSNYGQLWLELGQGIKFIWSSKLLLKEEAWLFLNLFITTKSRLPSDLEKGVLRAVSPRPLWPLLRIVCVLLVVVAVKVRHLPDDENNEVEWRKEESPSITWWSGQFSASYKSNWSRHFGHSLTQKS